jgi:ketol-acid reductoisomerase
MSRTFEIHDADPALLEGKLVAILGYGNQGHAHALNLRDAGVSVVVGARPQGHGYERARAAGFEVVSFAEAASRADIVMLLLPDEVQAEVYDKDLAPRLKEDAVLGFAHGFVLAFGLIELPPEQRAFLVAPKGQGHKLRAAVMAGGGLPGLIGVEGPDEENTLALALAYARCCGALAGGGSLTSFREEAVSDQFGEQAVLCGGLVELITAGWETLVERGYSPETAYFECLHEVKLIVDLIHARGVDGMRKMISTTAAFGGLRAGRRVIGEPSRKAMRELLDEIESGEFAREFLTEQAAGSPRLRAEIESEAAHPMQSTGRDLRKFLQRCRLGDTQVREKGSHEDHDNHDED